MKETRTPGSAQTTGRPAVRRPAPPATGTELALDDEIDTGTDPYNRTPPALVAADLRRRRDRDG